MRKLLLFMPMAACCLLLIAAMSKRSHLPAKPTVAISTTSLEITSSNGVTLKYIVRGYEAKNLIGVDHGSVLNTTPGPETGKAGSIKSKGVANTVDPKGKPAPAGTFFCAAYTRNLQTGVKYYARPYIKLQDGTIIYGAERTITMK